MTPYRTPHRSTEPHAASGFAFPSAVVRVGHGRFELSFWNPIALLVAVSCPVLLLAFRFTGVPLYLAVGALALTASVRVALVISTESAWLEKRVFGFAWSRVPLGRHPRAESSGGWDFNEMVIVPSDPALRVDLNDERRAVMVEWGIDPARERDALLLIELVNSEVARLHTR